MKALYFDGKKLRLKDMPRPQPAPHEALIKVQYAGICNTDIEILQGYMDFVGIPGHEFVGKVEECAYSDWIGKKVVGEINIACGKCEFCMQGLKTHCINRTVLGIYKKDGAFAEYLTLPLQNLHVLPPAVPEIEAVFTEPLAAACEIVEQLDFLEEYRVLLLGDGKLAQLIAQVLSLYTDRLTVVGKSENKLKLIRKLGAKTFLKDEFTAPEKSFHVVIEATGSWSGWDMAIRYVRPRGFIVLKSTYAGKYDFNLAPLVVDEITLIGSRCGPFTRALSLLERNQINLEPLISGIYEIENFERAFEKSQEKGILKILFHFPE